MYLKVLYTICIIPGLNEKEDNVMMNVIHAGLQKIKKFYWTTITDDHSLI